MFDDISDPAEMDKPVAMQGLIKHALTVTDTRNGDKLATMTYWVDMVNGRACGANVDGAIEVDTFVQRAAGIPLVLTKPKQDKRASMLWRLLH